MCNSLAATMNPKALRRALQRTVTTWLMMLLAGGAVAYAQGDSRAPAFAMAWGEPGDEPGQFHSPIGIAVNANDEIYVTDLNNARVQKFTLNGKYLGEFDLPLDSPPRDSCIIGGIAIDNQGLLYLSFMTRHKVAVYNDAGEVAREWGSEGEEDGEFNQPGGVLIRPNGTLLVADQGNHRVQKFTLDGKSLGHWGEFGEEPGQFGGPAPVNSRFAGPHFIARDSQGRLYTTEGILGRVQQFSHDGKPLATWGDKGDQPGGFGGLDTGFESHTFGPIGVFVDRQDRVWVSSLNDRVQAFTTEGEFLYGLGGTGSEPGQFIHPHGMAADRHGFFYVADSGNQRIQKFKLPPE